MKMINDPPLTGDALFDLIDEGHRLAGLYRSGSMKKRSAKVKAMWVEQAAKTLGAMADELSIRAGSEGHYNQQRRVAARNLRQRAQEEEWDRIDAESKKRPPAATWRV